MNDNYIGKTLIFRTALNETEASGMITFTPQSISIRLTGFEKFIHLEQMDATVLELEDSKFCTVTGVTTSSGSIAAGRSICHNLDIAVNQAIIGCRPWTSNDMIVELSFKIHDCRDLMLAPDILQKISAAGKNPPDTKIIEVRSPDATINISYLCSFDFHHKQYRTHETIGKISFHSAKAISEVVDYIEIIKTFLTMAAGNEVRLSDYWIRPKDDSVQLLLNRGTEPLIFQLIWPGSVSEKSAGRKGSYSRGILSTWGASDRETTSTCLTFWLENWPTWRSAFLGLFWAIRAKNTFDTDRIINSCKWLESTPDAMKLRAEKSSDMDQIVTAAIAKAQELGLNIDQRLSGAIRQIGTESRDSAFRRLIDQVAPDKEPSLKELFRKDLHTAYRIRGNFAHSKFDYSNTEDFSEYVRAVRAVEALAYLLLYRSLPLPEDHPWPYGPESVTDYLFEISN